MTEEPTEANKQIRKEFLSSLPIPYPYLMNSLDQYYGISPLYEEEREMQLKQIHVNEDTQSGDWLPGKKMRILLATFWNYPIVGGLSRYLNTIKNGLESLGHRVDIIAPNHFASYAFSELRDEIGFKSKHYYMERYGSFSREIISNNRKMYSYEIMLREINLEIYDVFHAHDRFTANILGRLNLYYKKPLFFTPHGFMTYRRLKFKLMKEGSVDEAYFSQIDKKAIEVADRTIMLCEAFRPVLTNLGVDDSKLLTIHTGVDFKPIRKMKSKADNVVITCVSRLRSRKGHKFLLEALALIPRNIKKVRVFIVGEGEMREELEDQAEALHLSNVYFLGARKDIPELLSQSDIFIHPTTSDALPISVIEAMFAEQAIITTNCGGIPEIIQHQHTGLITEPGDSKQLAETLLLLLQDNMLREKLAHNAKQYAETHLTIANMVGKIEEVYQSFLKNKV